MAQKKAAAAHQKKELDWQKIERAASTVEAWPAFMKGTPWQPSSERPETDKPKVKARAAGK